MLRRRSTTSRQLQNDSSRAVFEFGSEQELSAPYSYSRSAQVCAWLHNVCSVWIPHNLTDIHKETRVNCAKHIRRLFFAEGMDSFCNKLVVQDETWFDLEVLPTEQQNRCWLQKDQPRLQVARRKISTKKVMLLVAFSPSKRFSISAVPPGETVNTERVIDFVRHTGDL